MKKFVLGAAALGLTCLALTSCSGNSEKKETGKVIEDGKIGFILPGTIGTETQTFIDHWTTLGKEYGVEIITKNFKGQDPSYYQTCANELIAQGADAIICNFEMDGKESVIETCIDEEVYVGYSGSAVSDDVFKEWEENPYFLGQIAPSKEQEEKQAYDMTKYFIELYYGANKIDRPAGTSDKFAVWPVDFHGINLEHQMTYRWKGIKKALADYGVTVSGDSDYDSAKWTVTYTADSILKDKVLIMGNNLTNMDALIAQCAGILAQNPCTVITSCMADYLLNMFATYGAMAKGTRFATIDSFGTDYNKWFEADSENKVPAFKVAHTPYMVGKFGAINEAIVAVTARAFAGDPIRAEGNKAINVDQTYWVTTTKEEFLEAQRVSKAFAWKKADFDKIKNEKDLQDLYDNATLANLAKLI